MQKLKLYTVIKASSDKTFEGGDIIWLSENGDMNNANKGWLPKEEWNVLNTNDFDVVECKTHCLYTDKWSEIVKKCE